MEYRLPAPINRRHEWASSLITLFRYNGYHLEFFSFPERLNANHFDLIALPLTLNATSPEAMDQLIFEKLQVPLLSDPVESSMSVRSYQSDDGRKIGIRCTTARDSMHRPTGCGAWLTGSGVCYQHASTVF